MQITKKNLTPTKVELTIVADAEQLARAKERVLTELASGVKMAGFRKGKAPKALVEKSVDQTELQTRFLDAAVNDIYVAAVSQERVRPVAQPEVSIKKFVPFSTVEVTATVDAIGEIKLANYKKIKMTKTVEAVNDKDVEGVIDRILARDAVKKEVKRAAKDGDEVTIDFKGVDAKTKEAISGAEGENYPLVIGSGTFIPGFEPELIGLKFAEEKSFDIVFPADYSAKELQKKKVNFTVTVKKIEELELPKLNDAFAAKVGPFKQVSELRADIRRQLEHEKQQQADRKFENELLAEIAEKSTAAIPKSLVDEEIGRMEAEEKRNLMYRGQTWQEHLKAEGKTEEEHFEEQRELAEVRVKTGLVLAEVAEVEKVDVTPEELDIRIMELKKQYASDQQMQAELSKPENRREIASRILTEKTIAVLSDYATKK